MSLTIPGIYLQRLRNAKPEIITHPQRGGNNSQKSLDNSPLIIPPINTDIRFVNILRHYDASKDNIMRGVTTEPVTLPGVFDWGHENSTDTEEIKKKKTMIVKPGNQGLCGSCWAISVANAVSDNFVVSGVVNWIPNLSTTWALSTYPQGKCNGGNPSVLIEDISRGGISSNHCVDYSWCLKNDLCNGSSTQHFDAMAKAQAINNSVPQSGCYYNTEHSLYFIEPNAASIFIGANGVTEQNISTIVKTHILTKGPVIGGYIIFNNFMPGNFSRTGGVYLENAVYDYPGKIQFSQTQASSNTYKGAHAVSIIGWGIARGIVTDNQGTLSDVPYWYCRNSWTSTWGDNGYFKIAMYPWNRISQFDKVVVIQDQSGNNIQCGGIVMFEAKRKPTKKLLGMIPNSENSKKLKDNEFYQTSETETPIELSEEQIPKINLISKIPEIIPLILQKKTLIILLVLIIMVIIIILK